MPVTMPKLTKMDCSGGEAIWKEYLKDHNERVNPITKTLYAACKKCINFSFTGWEGKEVSFKTASLCKIAHLIEFGYINVKLAPEMFYNEPASVAAIYMPDWDMLLVKNDLFPVDLHDRSLVVHEAVHMINDRDNRTLTNIDNEAMAYIVQAMYYRKATADQKVLTGTEVGQLLSTPQQEGLGLGLSAVSTFWDQYTHDLAGNPLKDSKFQKARAKFKPKDKTAIFPRDANAKLERKDYPMASPARFVDKKNKPMSYAFNFAFLIADILPIKWLSDEAADLVDYLAMELMSSLLLTAEYKGMDQTTATANGIKDTTHWSE